MTGHMASRKGLKCLLNWRDWTPQYRPVHMPNTGKVDAATAATNLQASFQGGAPFGNQLSEDILLGDVVVSKGRVQYDLGRQFPNNRFVRKDSPLDNLPRPARKIRTVLAKLQTEQDRTWLQNKTSEHLTTVLRQRLSDDLIIYPGPTEDILFKSSYPHKHHGPLECVISWYFAEGYLSHITTLFISGLLLPAIR